MGRPSLPADADSFAVEPQQPQCQRGPWAGRRIPPLEGRRSRRLRDTENRDDQATLLPSIPANETRCRGEWVRAGPLRFQRVRCLVRSRHAWRIPKAPRKNYRAGGARESVGLVTAFSDQAGGGGPPVGNFFPAVPPEIPCFPDSCGTNYRFRPGGDPAGLASRREGIGRRAREIGVWGPRRAWYAVCLA